MAKRLAFAEFERALSLGTFSVELLPQYLEFDDKRAVPRLVLRRDALFDIPPEDYDVDEAVYRFLRRKEAERAQAEAFELAPKKCVLAEGDSWFNLPPFLRPPAIADWIRRHGRFRVRNIARWGHTLQRILHEKEYAGELASEVPDYFLFTAGGNDLQEGLESGAYVHQFEQGRPLDAYLTADGEAEMRRIELGHATVFAEVARNYPNLPILCHGYDYPRPLVGGGKYIGKFLRRKGIPDELMEPIVRHFVDRLNAAIETAASRFPTTQYVDCRRMTDPYTWYDDMHPDRDGFEAIAVQIEARMPQAR